MKKLMMVAGCAAVALSFGPVAARAEEDAALKAQQQELMQKIADRDKAIDSQAAVAAAKQAADAAKAATVAARKTNAEYVRLTSAKNAAREAQAKVLADLAAKDEQYAAAKTQAAEVDKKSNEAAKKLKDVAPDAKAALEAELSAIKAQKAPLQKTMSERMKVIEALPEAVAAKKAADEAKSALEAFEKSDAELGRLSTAEKDAQAAYNKAKNDGQAADAERAALQKQLNDLHKK